MKIGHYGCSLVVTAVGLTSYSSPASRKLTPRKPIAHGIAGFIGFVWVDDALVVFSLAVVVGFVVVGPTIVSNFFQSILVSAFSYASARETKTLKGSGVGSTKTSVTVMTSIVADTTVVVVTVVGLASHSVNVEHWVSVFVEYSVSRVEFRSC